ncbi:putative Fe-containing alcohol dehydrogenase [Tirmania nivea]|nr:putative Fe-containing alcohol dehydrogenase [Tirmania nivea]
MLKPTLPLRALTRLSPTPRTRALSLLNTIQYTHPSSCPCHTNPSHHHQQQSQRAATSILTSSTQASRGYATPVSLPSRGSREYAFEMASSTVRFGSGCTGEVGMDFANMGFGRGGRLSGGKVLVVTDGILEGLPVMKRVIESLEREGVRWEIYSRIRVEPKDYSVREAIDFGKKINADAYLAVGGGSVMDTAKMINLYGCYPEADLMDFVNAPLGKGLPIDKPLRPLICIPTTAGTGSETTGTAIFDIVSSSTKTGISHRNLKPTLGIIDPLNTHTLPPAITASSGLDVLCHSLESLTAIPYQEREAAKSGNPLHRPAYQGANPISDVFSFTALKLCIEYLSRATYDQGDAEAREKMALAATLAGVGFGNAGVHLCHGMSYPISGLNPAEYKHPGYSVPHALIPHGVSVAVTAPAVFRFTAPSNPERHLQAAEAFGVDVSNVRRENAGEVLSEAIKQFLEKLGGQPRGLKGLGIKAGDIGKLVDGTVPQRRVLVLAPGLAGEGRVVLEGGELERQRGELARLLEEAMEW